MKKHLIISAVALGLTACGGDQATVTPGTERDAARQGLVYAYPADNQLEVPTPAPIVLRFSSAVVDTNPESFITVRDADGNEVPYTIETGIGDGQGLVLTPEERLTPRSEYTVEIDGVTLERGAAQPRMLSFTTKGLTEGPRELVASTGQFELLRKIPDGDTLPILDFSSFRLQFNQPVDRTTVSYGSSVALEGPDGVVDAHLIVHGPYMTVDPKEDLTPGVEYTLSLSNAIQSVYTVIDEDDPSDSVDVFPGYSVSFTPLDSGSRSALTQEVSDDMTASILTGKPVNMIPMEAVLLGDDNQTQQSGFIQAELAHIPTHPDFAPLRIKRGSMLSGTDMEVLIGGQVPAGFSSGDVKIHFISDAVGYLERNPYHPVGQAPEGTRRQLRLFMDVAITAEDPRANGAVTQDLMHLELIGTAEIRDGRLTADAVSVAEPRILGSENAKSVLSFFMQSNLEDGESELSPDNSPLIAQSWSHEGRGNDSSNSIIINFTKPLDLETLHTIRLTEFFQSQPEDLEIFVYLDGSSIIIDHGGQLENSRYGSYGDEVYGYEVYFGDVKDFGGGSLQGSSMISFSNKDIVENEEWNIALFYSWEEDVVLFDFYDFADVESLLNRSPVVLMAYPGYPCAIADEFQDIENLIAGRCLGGLSEHYQSSTGNIERTPDDLLPIMGLPANRGIRIRFTSDIDPESVSLGDSFSVRMMGDNGDFSEEVKGVLEVYGAEIYFTPEIPWKEDEIYKYVISSNGDNLSAGQASCDSGFVVCGINGLPIQTQLYSVDVDENSGALIHAAADANAGGPNFEQIFYGERETKNVNFYHDYSYALEDKSEVLTSQMASSSYYDIRSSFEDEPAVDPSITQSERHPLDPHGIKPIENSVKILSASVWQHADIANGGATLNGLVTGCAYGSISEPDPFPPDIFYIEREPVDCPERQFSYLHSAISAEVTENFVPGKGLEVLIWPSHIIGTSLPMGTITANMAAVRIDSGKQLMRMRYAKEDPACIESSINTCNRNRPISGYIYENSEGNPEMSAEVDLYIDAAGLSKYLQYTEIHGLTHNMTSLPVTMNLSGEVEFLDDGRMIVNQINREDVSLHFELETSNSGVADNMGSYELIVPAGGSYLLYKSSSIK